MLQAATRAETYDTHAAIPLEIGRRLLERLDYLRLDPALILDAGSGTGAALAALIERYSGVSVVAFDHSEHMLHAARRGGSRLRWFLPRRKRAWPVCGDARALPLASGRADLVWSNLMLPAVSDIAPVLAEWRRVLSPGGCVMFATLGPDTLRELREALGQRRSPFPDMHDVGDALLGAGFSDPVMDMETLTLTYPDLRALLREWRVLRGPAPSLLDTGGGALLRGRAGWRELTARYPRGGDTTRWPLSIEVVYGHAWRPLSEPEKRITPGEPAPLRFYPRSADGRSG